MQQLNNLKKSGRDEDFPTGGAYSAPPDPLAVFKGPTSKGREGNGSGGKEAMGKGRGG